MNLHKNKDEFLNTLIQVNKEKNIALAILEKDYYVTLLLKEVVKKYLTWFLKEAHHYLSAIK
jgi:hypothetical protein